ncbi:hypothetical protein ASO20_02505 [Mycoplasma sp. (ex Biomphalaria glabrata)]|uniref:segregation/condensation protein A n=1 Tax=Mycoplasma sp. (ex Biomphalaria glabrata) TaxID=1749074 RepID=UPI00073A7279|nr:segregation/condensation protein A [Mycoplasma sp. (ex Biomphalaria glabrata)]ALV23506.1 hypothetical protein ASO20_02505 [Mycoplasma sp. (ex Biomphalaria glabrata)]
MSEKKFLAIDAHKFTLENFEGPMDLLLSMVRDKKIDLLEIDLLNLIQQYCDFVTKNIHTNIDDVSEYLVMATYLLELKSKLLLPKTKLEVDEDMVAAEKDKLINALIEYSKFKKVSALLQKNFLERQYFYDKIPMDLTQIKSSAKPTIRNVSWDKVNYVLKNMIERIAWEKPLDQKIVQSKYSQEEVKEVFDNFVDELTDNNPISIYHVLKAQNIDRDDYLTYFVLLFTTLLELVKEQRVFIDCNENDVFFVKR